MKAWKAESFLLFVTLIWGGTFVFTKLGLADCPPSLFILIRFSIALTLAVIFFGRHLMKIKRRTFLHGMVLGLIFGGGFLLQTYGLKLTTVSKSAFITGISVVLTPFAYYIIERKSINRGQKLGVFIAAVGLYLFTDPKIDHLNAGDVMTLLSTMFWAFYITYMDVFTRDIKDKAETYQLVAMQFVAAAPLTAIFYFLIDRGGPSLHISHTLLTALAYNGIIASFVLTLIHTSVQRYTTPVKAALIFSLEPVVANIIAVFVFAELLNLREYTGAIVLLSGVIISEITGRKKEKFGLAEY